MIDPIAFEIGPLQLHWYGIIIASAVLIAALLGARVASWLGENPEDGWSMLLLVVITGVIGARIYHVIHLWNDYYSQNLAAIPQIWNGGIGIPGALAGGAVGILVYTRSRGISTARWLDVFAPAALLGQVIGRLGNFVNQELYGPPTSLCGVDYPVCLPFGIPIDAAHRVPPWDPTTYPVETTSFVPLFAYEMALNFIGMLVILFAIRRFGPRLFAGDAALMYIMWYGAVRTGLESYRVNNWTILGVPTAMWVGIIGFLAAGAWLIYRHRRGWGSPMIRPAEDRAADAPSVPQPHPEASAG
ncbi:MAG: prolipoprotein diacylglyceryl transferase [Chloroflexi bacterium]|nr:prolipoprotein diacylglyceryl transferase [Chloroflexota bacterium]